MDLVTLITDTIAVKLRQAALELKQKGMLAFDELPDFTVEAPREKEHGDFAANLALLLARPARKAPREIAGLVCSHLDRHGTWIENVDVAGPGFINFRLNPGWLFAVPGMVLGEGERYGCSETGRGQKVQVEFVSANPTGLLHMGNARGAALGDSIASLLEATGYQVTREFYINDSGNQVENFARSLEARYLQALGHDVPFPDEGYHGGDLIATIKGLIEQVGDKYVDVEPALRREMLVRYALDEKLARIRKDLERFRVRYDVWFSEQTLHDSGAVARAVTDLQERGCVYERDGALWFKAAAFGEDKDEVVVRKNGLATYFAADIAYHQNKFQRGFDRVINLWGADHHGHVARMQGAMAALGYDPDRLTVVLMQLVRLFQNGEMLRKSKRTGQYVTLEELVDEVGVDAARYFFVMRSADSHLDFDLDLAVSQSGENPVYYVQYAHARICSILRQDDAGGDGSLAGEDVDCSLLTEPEELELLRKIADFPGVVAGAAQALEPHRLTAYAHQLAGLFHVFYTNCRVLVEDRELRRARLALAAATRITLNNLLRLIGVSAPERM